MRKSGHDDLLMKSGKYTSVSVAGLWCRMDSLTSTSPSIQLPWWQVVSPGSLDRARSGENLVSQAKYKSESRIEHIITSVPKCAPNHVTRNCKRTLHNSIAIVIHHIYYYNSLKTL